MNPAFKIGERLYDIPQRFRLGDAVLIKELTGLEFDEFSERMDAMNDAVRDGDQAADMLVVMGLLGIAVWQGNERWSRDRVRAFVETLDISSFAIEGGDEDPPPVVASEESLSHATSNGSTITPADSPEALV